MPHRLGRYAVQRRIGAGGFATVWLAYDEQLDSPVAVKVLADNWSADAQVRRRFVEEGRYLRRVESPHVVTVYDAGELDDGRPYLVMTYADQGTLADRLELSGLTPPQALQVVRQVADGLQALHDRDILHRDVKPANVLFRSTSSGRDIRAMLGDLGLGKALDMSSRLTIVAGTPSYVAPEQAQAEPLDPRADQYSLAALAYLLLTGRPAFDHASLRAAAAPGPVPALSTEERPFAASVEDVVRRGLAPQRDDRYASVTDFADALAAAMLESTGDAPAVTTAGDPWLAINNDLTLPGARPTASPAAAAPASVTPASPGATGLPHPRDPERLSAAREVDAREVDAGAGGVATRLVTSAADQEPGPAAGHAPAGGGRRGWTGRRGRRRLGVVAALAVVAAGAGYATYAATRPGPPGPRGVTVTDAEGLISVTVPASWAKVEATDGWAPPIHQPKTPDTYPAVSVGTSDVWNSATVDGRGVFASIIPGDRFPTHLPGHPRCTAATPSRSTTDAGQPVIGQLFTACPGGVVVEQFTQLDGSHLLWVQVHGDTATAAYDVLATVQAKPPTDGES
ncbi:serine/threonine-protein kinase [Nocardioides sp. DS6]|uniref:non-specific serine/threonine protein kinase n=1 Tax=Nocardioides eburneus TaxID=3231482 RepID=A0ABV3STU9_9ACTN